NRHWSTSTELAASHSGTRCPGPDGPSALTLTRTTAGNYSVSWIDARPSVERDPITQRIRRVSQEPFAGSGYAHRSRRPRNARLRLSSRRCHRTRSLPARVGGGWRTRGSLHLHRHPSL